MSEKKAKAHRQELRAQGIDPMVPPVGPNITNREDTREERRTKKFRKRRHEEELKSSSLRQRMVEINKWNRAYTATPQAKAEKQMLEAAEKALAEMEAEEEKIA